MLREITRIVAVLALTVICFAAASLYAMILNHL